MHAGQLSSLSVSLMSTWLSLPMPAEIAIRSDLTETPLAIVSMHLVYRRSGLAFAPS
jgi:hypothetical protein